MRCGTKLSHGANLVCFLPGPHKQPLKFVWEYIIHLITQLILKMGCKNVGSIDCIHDDLVDTSHIYMVDRKLYNRGHDNIEEIEINIF